MACAYHLGKLPADRVPTKHEILSSYLFNRLTYQDMGRIFYHGTDEEGNLVYSVGRGRCKHLISSLRDLVLLIQKSQGMKEQVLFSNTSPTVPFAMTFGGFFSRGLKMDPIGVPLLVKGAKQFYRDITNLVHHTKEVGRNMTEDVKILENKSFT
jgi:hypothetical protein